MSFVSDQLGGTKTYSKGILIGNWSEDMAVREGKMRQFIANKGLLGGSSHTTDRRTTITGIPDSTITSISSRAKPNIYNARYLQQRVSLIPIQKDRFLRFGQPLMIKCDESRAFLAVDTNPRYCPRRNHYSLSATTEEAPQVRTTWLLHKVPDVNDKFYSRENESDIVHYGQSIRIVNEYATSDGYITVNSMPKSATAQSRVSKRQEVTGCLGGGSGGLFIIEQSDGKSLACPMEGHPVKIGDRVVLRHKMTNNPLVCEDNFRFNTTFGPEYEVAAQLVKPQYTNMSTVTQSGNFFSFVSAAWNSVFKPFESDITVSALQRVKEKLLSRGTCSFVSMRKVFQLLEKSSDAKVSRLEFKEGMEMYGCPLTTLELDVVFKVYDADGSGGITLSEFLNEMRGHLPENRRDLVTKAFKYLDKEGSGVLAVSELVEIYSRNIHQHPEVLSGTKTEKHVLMEFVAVWDCRYGTEKNNGYITFRDFMDYYSEISASIDDDYYFEVLIQSAWQGVDGVIQNGSSVNNKGTKRRVLVIYDSNDEEVVELDSDVGSSDAEIKDALAKKGIQGISRVELCM
eukprot:Tbor_TRINITY_DN5621_c2_g1::TRINITY_DN5621_c2_g1_i1::g.8324::m.8324